MVSLPFPFLLLGFSCPPASWGPSMFLGSGLSMGERLASVRAPAGPGVPVQGLPSALFTLWLFYFLPSWLGPWAKRSVLPTCAFWKGWRTDLYLQGTAGLWEGQSAHTYEDVVLGAATGAFWLPPLISRP